MQYHEPFSARYTPVHLGMGDPSEDSLEGRRFSNGSHGRVRAVRPDQDMCPDLDFSSAPGGTRIPNLLIRSQMLYPIELRALAPVRTADGVPDLTECRCDSGKVACRISQDWVVEVPRFERSGS